MWNEQLFLVQKSHLLFVRSSLLEYIAVGDCSTNTRYALYSNNFIFHKHS